LAPVGQICLKFGIGDTLTSFEEIKIWLKLDRNTECFTGGPHDVYVGNSGIKYTHYQSVQAEIC